MQKISITGTHSNAFECEGHLDLIFDQTTNVRIVKYVNVVTRDGIKHPFTLLITDENKVQDTIEELKRSYGDEVINIEISPDVRIEIC